jgi:hypothetical protein
MLARAGYDNTITHTDSAGNVTRHVPASALRRRKSDAKALADHKQATKLALLQSVGNASELASGDC